MSVKRPDAEREVLSAVMRGGQTVRSDAKDLLGPDMFYEYPALAQVIFSLLDDDQRPDPATVKARFDDEAQVDRIAGIQITPQNVLQDQGAIADVRSAHRAAQGLLAVQDAEKAIVQGERPVEVQRSLEADLRALDERLDTGGSMLIGEVIDESLKRVLAPSDERGGLAPPLGLADIFRVKDEDVVIVGGRTTQGKTAMVLRWCMEWSIHEGIPGLYFSIEGSADELGARLLSMDARVDTQSETDDEEEQRLKDVAERVREAPFHIDDSATLDVSQVRARLRRLAHEEGIRYVVIDYLQLLNPDPAHYYEKKSDRMTGMVRSLKKLARSEGVPVIIVTQVNRGVEQRDPPAPRLADIREGGEEPADKVLLVFRPEHYGMDQFRDYTDLYNAGWVSLAKHRTGPTAEWWLSFVKRYSLWGEQSLRDEETVMEPDDHLPF